MGINLRVLCTFLLVVAGIATATAQTTALDDYVAAPDATYTWSLESTIPGAGFTDYVLRLTSQTWLTPAEVDQPVWQHWLILTVPDTVGSSTGLLEISSGSGTDSMPGGNASHLRTIALSSGTVTARLRQVPNQPLSFTGQPPKWEDAQIAYAWRRFLETGNTLWLSRLPMTKSAVRAMDAVTEFMASPAGGGIAVSQFAVMGASKRGWTTWTTAAVDERVVAIAPMVIDLLNIDPSFRHHYWALGRYAPSIQDYVNENIMAWMGTPEWQELVSIVEPFSYRERLDMPKLIVNSTGDQFFLPDSSQFYFRQLKDEKLLRYVPNTGHGLNSIATDDIEAWYWCIVNGVPRPSIKWTKDDQGRLAIETVSGTPTQVLLWQATNLAARDFNIDNVGAAYSSSVLAESEPGKYEVLLPDPAAGFKAFFVEFTYDVGGPKLLRLTTEVSVVPDELPHGPRYNLGASTDLIAPDFYTSSPNGMAAFWGALNNAGTTVAFYGVDLGTFATDIYLVDLGDTASWRKLTNSFPEIPQSLVSWAPDDSVLFISTFRVDATTGLVDEPSYFGFPLNDTATTAREDENWLLIHASAALTNNQTRNLVALPILPNGLEDTSRTPAVLTNFEPGRFRGGLDWPAISPNGNHVAFVDYDESDIVGVPDIGDLYILTDLNAILSAPRLPGSIISSLAPTSLADARIQPIRTGGTLDNFAESPAFSQDGSLLLYGEDWNNVFRNADFFNTLEAGDWDVMISRTDGVGGDNHLQTAGNQAVPIPTNGGTRLLYTASVADPLDLHLYITTLEIATPINGTVVGNPADNDVITVAHQNAMDASGTTVAIPPGTTIDFPVGVPRELAIQTPIHPIDEPQLPPGNQYAMPVVRTFGPSGTLFSPAITVTISYTDQEVGAIPDESQIEVFLYNEISGVFDIPVTVTARDTAANTISFDVTHFSTFGLGSETDSDNDGMPDVWEVANLLDPDNPADADADLDLDGLTNLEEFAADTDPRNEDTDNDGLSDGWEVSFGLSPLDDGSVDVINGPAGDPDGDGFTNLEEFQGNSDPTDSENVPQPMPLLGGWGGLAVLAGLLAVLACAIYLRRTRPAVSRRQMRQG